MTMLLQQMDTAANPMNDSSELAKPKSSTIRRRSKSTKTVTFGSIVINEHPIIAGCHPAVSSGVPVESKKDQSVPSSLPVVLPVPNYPVTTENKIDAENNT